MKFTILPLAVLGLALQLFPAFAADTVQPAATAPTKEQIKQAQATRDAGIKAGADKIGREEILKLARQNIPEELTDNQRKALERAVLCTHHKIAALTYRAPIEDFARFLTQPLYQEKVKTRFDKECNMGELNEILDSTKKKLPSP